MLTPRVLCNAAAGGNSPAGAGAAGAMPPPPATAGELPTNLEWLNFAAQLVTSAKLIDCRATKEMACRWIGQGCIISLIAKGTPHELVTLAKPIDCHEYLLSAPWGVLPGCHSNH